MNAKVLLCTTISAIWAFAIVLPFAGFLVDGHDVITLIEGLIGGGLIAGVFTLIILAITFSKKV